MQEKPQPVQVFLRGGVYSLEQPWSLGSVDAGKGNYFITYQAYKSEKPILSGGKVVSGWQSLENGLYRASVPGLRTRQLYVNGKRAIRARTPNQENQADMGPYLRFLQWDVQNRRLLVKSEDIGKWGTAYRNGDARSNPVEMIVQSHWHLYIFRVEELQPNEETTWLTPFQPERDEPSFGHIAVLDPQGKPYEQESYFWENAFEFLDAPGEWYLDEAAGFLYYYPLPGEDLDSLEVVVPQLETLLVIQGEEDRPVENLAFRGLTFAYTTWLGPSDEGYAPWQAALRSSSQQGDPFPGMVSLSNANFIYFIANTFEKSGMHALVTLGKTQGLKIENNLFHDLSGAAIMVDVKADPDGGSLGDHIKGNIIRETGRVYTDSCAIWASFPRQLVIEHNEIFNQPYTAISVGWRWDSTPTAAQDNYIAHNHIHHALQKHDDGGGIYTLGRQPWTRLFENYVHDLDYAPQAGSYPIAGIYLDEGSDGMTLSAHVIEAVPRGNEVNLHKTGEDITFDKPVLLDPQSKEGQALIENAGP